MISFDLRPKLLPRAKGHDTASTDRDFLTGFWVSTRSFVFVSQLKITKAREANGIAAD
jgi:hypothetical protein